VLPRLPQPKAGGKATDLSKLATAMSIGTGFLFERCLVPYLQAKFPTYTLVEQPKLQWQEFSGTADYLLLDYKQKHGMVIDAKAFRSPTLREIKERKLTDNWSYPTQLAIYHMAANQDFGDALEIDAYWYVWSVPSAKLFVVPQEYGKSERLANAASVRALAYTKVQELLQEGDYRRAAEIASSGAEPLLAKGYFYGNICAATKFHYNPYADLFYPEQDPDSEDYGLPLEGEPLTLLVERLMHDTHTNADHSYYRQYLLDKGYEIN